MRDDGPSLVALGSAKSEFSVDDDGAAGFGTVFGETAGEDVVDPPLPAEEGEEVMYAFSWEERVRYLAMLRWQVSSDNGAFLSSSFAVS